MSRSPRGLRRRLGPIESQIGKHVAGLVEHGSCLQAGIGAVPDAALAELIHHRNPGIHTELLTDGFLRLIEAGAVNHSRKKVHRGKSVSTFMMGSQSLYDYVHDHPAVLQLGADYVNNPAIIARNDRVVAINSAVEIDLTGQVCADSIGHRVISGVGGQMDFLRGAALSEKREAHLGAPESDSERELPSGLRSDPGSRGGDDSGSCAFCGDRIWGGGTRREDAGGASAELDGDCASRGPRGFTLCLEKAGP